MKRIKRLFQVNLALVIILFFALGYAQFTTMQRLDGQIASLNTKLSSMESSLSDQLELVNTNLNLQVNRFDLFEQQVIDSFSLVDASIVEISSSTKKDLLGLNSKISSVQLETQQSLEGLEDRLVSLDISSSDFTAIVQDVLDAVISISTNKGVGSGVIIDDRGFAVTNFHVIDGITSGGIRLYDNTVLPFGIVAINEEDDLALIQIVGDTEFKQLRFERKVRVGERVIALGNPAGLDFTVTEGIISAVGRKDQDGTVFIQTDVPINPGNSGGPLVNTNGRIVGINTLKSEGFEGLGFAIEVSIVEDFVDDALASLEE